MRREGKKKERRGREGGRGPIYRPWHEEELPLPSLYALFLLLQWEKGGGRNRDLLLALPSFLGKVGGEKWRRGGDREKKDNHFWELARGIGGGGKRKWLALMTRESEGDRHEKGAGTDFVFAKRRRRRDRDITSVLSFSLFLGGRCLLNPCSQHSHTFLPPR